MHACCGLISVLSGFWDVCDPSTFPVCVQVIRKGEVSCCWICTTCKDNEYVQDEFTCKACELGWWPDDDLAGRRRDKMLLFLGDCSSLSSVTLIPRTSRLLLLERTLRTQPSAFGATPPPKWRSSCCLRPSLPFGDPVVVLTAIYRVESSSQFPGVKSYYRHERLGDAFQQSVEKDILPSLSLHARIWRILIERAGTLFIERGCAVHMFTRGHI